jgi:hypothetical protein
MGAWGEKAFQNDSALDWVAELTAGGVATLRASLSSVATTDEDDSVDVDDGAAAIAAAEIVAAALGHGRDRVTTEIGTWLDSHSRSLVAQDATLAKRAVERVLGAGSELRSLWDEGDSENAWRADVNVLLTRLARAAGAAESTSTMANPPGTERPRAVGERDKQVLVTFLQARGLEPTAQQMWRIRTSRDLAEIRRWLARAVHAPSVAALLDD